MASNKNIKGITIEVNGDVTKLDKALRSVDQELSTTQKNLKEVDRLLKLDPGNVELLDQKQRYLAQSVEQTAKRYETLKKALDESTASNVRFDAWTKAQADFQAEIKKTETELTGLLRQQQQLEGLRFAPDSAPMTEVQQKIGAARERLQQLQQQATQTFEALGRPISIDQYDALQRELAESKIAMEDAQKASDYFDAGITDMSKAEGTAAESTNSLSSLLGAAGISTSALTAAGAVAVAAKAIKEFAEFTADAVRSSAEFADEINTLSMQSGFSTDFLQELNYAAEFVDVDTEAVIASMRKLKKNLGSDSAEVRAAFEKLSLIPELFTMQGTSMEEIFQSVVTQLSNIDNELERDQIAMTLFGRGADELAGIIDDGGQKFREFSQYARENGYVLSGEELDALSQVDDQFVRLDKSMELAKKRMAIELAPEIINVTDRALDLIEQVDWEKFGEATSRFLDNNVPKLMDLAEAIVTVANALADVYVEMDKLNSKSGGWLSTAASFIIPGSGSLIPGFASGGVIEPNNPMLAVVGDNRTEREVIAPRSELVDAAREAIRAEGGTNGGQLVGVVRFTGTDQEIVRALGPKLQLLWSDTGASI